MTVRSAVLCGLLLVFYTSAWQAYVVGHSKWFFGLCVLLLGASYMLVSQLSGNALSVARQWWQRLSLIIVLLLCIEVGYIVVERFPNRVWLQTPQIEPIYDYDAAQEDPKKFKRWWHFYVDQWLQQRVHIEQQTPYGLVPVELRPNTQTTFFDGTIKINRHGFVGKDFAIEKSGQYRIVVLGGSHVMGPTLFPGDDPWPDLLQTHVAKKLRCSQPIEVINGGVNYYHLGHGYQRLKRKVLPLKPDMVIAYFGYNGFRSLYGADFPEVGPFQRPKKPRRAVEVLAVLEHRIQRWLHHYHPDQNVHIDLADYRHRLQNSQYAKLYAQYIAAAREHDFRLVLSPFYMAVNQNSSEEAIRFYSHGFEDVRFQIRINQLHNGLLEMLAADNPDVLLLEKNSQLDGAFRENYLDLVHFTLAGKQRLVASIFASLLPELKKTLGCQAK